MDLLRRGFPLAEVRGNPDNPTAMELNRLISATSRPYQPSEPSRGRQHNRRTKLKKRYSRDPDPLPGPAQEEMPGIVDCQAEAVENARELRVAPISPEEVGKYEYQGQPDPGIPATCPSLHLISGGSRNHGSRLERHPARVNCWWPLPAGRHQLPRATALFRRTSTFPGGPFVGSFLPELWNRVGEAYRLFGMRSLTWRPT